MRAYADRLVGEAADDLAAQVKARIARLDLWDYGTAPRVRFDPHVVLHGVEADGQSDPQLANPNPFPPVSHYRPQDHKGCQCRLRASTRTVKVTRTGGGPRVGRTLDSKGPQLGAVTVGRSRVTVTRSTVPDWWDEVVNPQTWTAALRSARGRVAGG